MHIHNRLSRMTSSASWFSDPSLTGLKLPNTLGGMVGRDEEIEYWPFCNGELQLQCEGMEGSLQGIRHCSQVCRIPEQGQPMQKNRTMQKI